jgi:hypothetical protein
MNPPFAGIRQYRKGEWSTLKRGDECKSKTLQTSSTSSTVLRPVIEGSSTKVLSVCGTVFLVSLILADPNSPQRPAQTTSDGSYLLGDTGVLTNTLSFEVEFGKCKARAKASKKHIKRRSQKPIVKKSAGGGVAGGE